MTVSYRTIGFTMVAAALLMASAAPRGQTAAEVFSATASVKGAGGGSATAPVTIMIDRTMSKSEASTLTSAFKAGGEAALRKALVGIAPTGSVKIGAGNPAPTRFTVERPTSNGRLITILTDQPLAFVGAGLPGAKPKEGYNIAVIDIEVDAKGSGSGSLAPAAKIKMNGDAFVVDDYGTEAVQLTAVRKTK